MKIVVLGYTGMLGRYVYTYLSQQNENVIGIGRKDFDVSDGNYSIEIKILELFNKLSVSKDDVIINCIGIIKPKFKSVKEMVIVNTIFPCVMSDICRGENVKFIHITTDCVFSGKTGGYDENSQHDPLDVYGKTKSLGEPNNATVIRTSIIGEEGKGESNSLLSWIISKKGKMVNGYINHVWNGITCLELAKLINLMIHINLYWKGARHIYTVPSINKLELIQLVDKVYDLDLTIIEYPTKESCDRTLSTIIHRPLSLVVDKSYFKQLKETKEFTEKYLK